MERPIPITLNSVWQFTALGDGDHIDLAAGPDQSWVVPGIIWSYFDTDPGSPTEMAPTQIVFTNTENSQEYFRLNVTAAGPGFITFPRPIKFPRGLGVTIEVNSHPTNYQAEIIIPGAYLD